MRIAPLAVIVLLSLFAISIASLAFMVDRVDCFSESLNGARCPAPADLFSFVQFHFSAYAKLAQAFLFSFFIFLAWCAAFPNALPSLFPSRTRTALSDIVRASAPFREWLALHETSPTR